MFVLLDRISPIRLPLRGELLTVGTELLVSGWGVTESSSSIVENLLFASVHSISNLQCAATYGTSVVIDSTVCTLGNPSESPCNVCSLTCSFSTFSHVFNIYIRETVAVLWFHSKERIRPLLVSSVLSIAMVVLAETQPVT